MTHEEIARINYLAKSKKRKVSPPPKKPNKPPCAKPT